MEKNSKTKGRECASNFTFIKCKQKMIINELDESNYNFTGSIKYCVFKLKSKLISKSKILTLAKQILLFKNNSVLKIKLIMTNSIFKKEEFEIINQSLIALKDLQSININLEKSDVDDNILINFMPLIRHFNNIKCFHFNLSHSNISNSAMKTFFHELQFTLSYFSECNIIKKDCEIIDKLRKSLRKYKRDMIKINSENPKINKKIKLNLTSISNEDEYIEEYGLGFILLKKNGFNIGKGLGKNENGRVEILSNSTKSHFEINKNLTSIDHKIFLYDFFKKSQKIN